MAITLRDLMNVISNESTKGFDMDMPIEVAWPTGEGSGETRKPLSVVIENSGEPEVPTLRFHCGLSYDEN